MTATVHDFRAEKAKRIALAKFEALCSLAEELEAVAPDYRDEVCAEYLQQGWATTDDLRMARKMLEGGA